MTGQRALLVFARAAVLDPDSVVDDGCGLWIVDGRVERILRGSAVRRGRDRAARSVDLGDTCLVPGFVNAHAHLDLSHLEGRLEAQPVERAGSFSEWVRSLLAARGDDDTERDAAVREGAQRALASGTTCVGDIDSSGHRGGPIARVGPRTRLYREVLDARDPERTEAAWGPVRRALPKRARVHEGLSPHAPFTVSEDLLRRVERARRRRAVPVAMHWSESLDEARWGAGEEGVLRSLVGAPPATSSLELLRAVGLLSPGMALIHGNHATPAERRTIAEEGAHLVHCPGSHAFFGRAPFDLVAWLRAGVQVALGTDSLASNTALDPRLEMAAIRRDHPEIGPPEVLRMATRSAAAALGFAGRAGALVPGAWADFAVHGAAPRGGADAVLDALTWGRTRVFETWIGGRRAWRADGSGNGPQPSP